MVSGLSAPELKSPNEDLQETNPKVEVARVNPDLAPGAASIRIQNVGVSYALKSGRGGNARRTVLEDISLDIEPGEFVVLLGETGCGKSTLLRMILGQERPTTGQIHVAGSPVQRVDARSGYVPQRYSLFPDRTVLENLAMGPETSEYHILGRLRPSFRAFRRRIHEEAYRQLAHMGLQPSDAHKYPHQLSGGMQQRVAIAQALMMRSRVLLMDEAFSALDPATRASLQRLLRSVWSETRPTVVFVTHNTAEALFLGTRVIVLARTGREDHCGSRIALDLKLPERNPAEGGMSLRTHGEEFLNLVDHIEHFSRGDRASETDETQGPQYRQDGQDRHDGETS
jgi:NitT/TauT family transport system ATP-binding protein